MTQPICVGIQFLFDPNTGEILKNVNREIEAYRITTRGRLFIGSKSVYDPLWVDFLDLLVENTLSSVTFYSESYTRAMMPDRIAGNLSDLMIAYSRVYRAINPNDSDDLSINDDWEKRINYIPTTGKFPAEGNQSRESRILIYPFLAEHSQPTPDIFKVQGKNTIIFSGYSMWESYHNSFPNIKLKQNLEENISSTNKDPFNILL